MKCPITLCDITTLLYNITKVRKGRDAGSGNTCKALEKLAFLTSRMSEVMV